MSTEADRILREYERRATEIPATRYSPSTPDQVFMRQTRERTVLQMLRAAGQLPLTARRILDVGCGHGQWLADFETWGAERGNLAGVDLVPERAASARERLGGSEGRAADIRAGDASRLGWPAESFDIVVQSMVISSILDPAMRQGVAAEMVRVLRPAGVILWFDFIVDNPRNKAVKGVSRADIAELFPGFRVKLARSNLAPPVARALAPRSWTLARLVERLRMLNTHAVAVLTPAEGSAGARRSSR
jgi:ubiquinone/menaquinone biosynthesis C-methylase UbiE